MDNKKILLSFLLVVLIALSLSSVSAEDVSDVVSSDDASNVVAMDENLDISSGSDNEDVLAANPVAPTTNTSDAIQTAVDTATAGGIVDLSDFASYDIKNHTIKVADKDNLVIKGNGTTTIFGYGDNDGFFYITSQNVTIQGIKFIDNNPKNNFTYNGTVAGFGVNFNGGSAMGGVVDNCYFKNFNQAVVVKSANNITVKNSYFDGGYATKLVNDPSVNKEKGSKVISIMGSYFAHIENNTFNGSVLDAISIAGGSGDAKIIGNKFINNVYSIFFGGASTEGTFIKNNIFDTCGYFKENSIYWDKFPVISIQKAASGVYIDNNTFKAINNNFLIAAEQGNTAHGYASSLGDINVTNNKVTLNSSDVVAGSIILLHINCKKSVLNPYANITVTGNDVAKGVNVVVVWSTEWGTENGDDIVIPAADLVQTQIKVTNVKDMIITATLTDIYGKALNNQNITYTIGGGSAQTITTNENGVFTITGQSGKEVAINFAETSKYAGSQTAITLNTKTVTPTLKTTKLTAPNKTFKVKKTKKVVITLKTVSNVIKGKIVTLKVKGKTYYGITNSKGKVTFKVVLKKKGTFKYKVNFAGDATYKAISKTGKIVVKK